MPVTRYRSEAGKLVERLALGMGFSPECQLLHAEVTAALAHFDEERGRHGFADVLVEMRRLCYQERGQRLCRRSNTRRINSQHVFDNLHRIMTRHLLAMSPAEAVAFLESSDANGVTIRDHAKGMFSWAPQSTSDGHHTIKFVLMGRHVDASLLASVKEVWAHPGRGQRYPLVVQLLHRSAYAHSGTVDLLTRLMSFADASGHLEELRNAFVGGLISFLRVSHGIGSNVEEAIIACAQLLALEGRHFMSGISNQSTILHCPMPPRLLDYCLQFVSPELLQKTASGKHVVEYWLSRYPEVDTASWQEAFSRLLDFVVGHIKLPSVFLARAMPAAMVVLLEHGAEVTEKDMNGNSVLGHFPTLNGEAVHALVNAGLDPNEACHDGPLLLRCLRSCGYALQISALQALLDCGCDVNARDHNGQNGQTALFYAQGPAIEALLAAGADPTAFTKAGGTPLTSFICKWTAVPPESLMVEANLTRLAVGYFRGTLLCTTALGFAVLASRGKDVLEALVNAGANPNGDPQYHDGSLRRPRHYLPPLLVKGADAKHLFQLGARLPADFQRRFKVDQAHAVRLLQIAGEYVGSLTKKA